nr:hypothetical protein [Tanacetum cinerariifolium]
MLPSRGFLMLSKPVEKIKRVSLAPGVIPGPSSDARIKWLLFLTPWEWERRSTVHFVCALLPLCFYFSYPPFESLIMSLGESDDLVLLDVDPAGPVLEADLHPRVVSEGMTMNALPNDALGLYAHHFQQGGLSVSDPFPKSNEYNASDVAKLREVVISLRKPPPNLLYVAGLSNVWKHAGHTFFLKDSKGKGNAIVPPVLTLYSCKITACTLLPAGMERVTHLANLTATLKDIPPKTIDMTVAEIPCRRVKVGIDKGAGKDGPQPLDTLANEGHVSPHVSAERMGVLRTQTDEHITPHANIDEDATRKEAHGYANANLADEGHRDNEEGCQHPEAVEKLARDKVVPDEEACNRMDNSQECRDMMSNLFTHADHEFFNDGVRDEFAIRRSWKMLCQSAQQQANTILCFEALKEEHADLVYAHESCKDSAHERLEELEEEKKDPDQLNAKHLDRIHQLKEALKQSEADVDQLRREKEHYAVEAGRGETVRQMIINQYLPTFVRRLHQSAEYKRSLGKVFSLSVGKGFIDRISIGRKDVDIQAILKVTPEVDPTDFDSN